MSLFGLLNLNKPPGVTSRRVVDQVQRLVKPDKVGHAGTLDPLASGVLVIGIGQATRLVEYVQQMPKQYRATFLLGRSSDTEDIEGEVTLLSASPAPSREEINRAAAALTGNISQRPPAYSALKVSGKRAYALARAGEVVELAPRQVQIYRLDLVRYEYPDLCLDVECGSGTYIRSLGRDLAESVGTAAVMSALVRTAIGSFKIDEAVDAGKLTRDNLSQFLLPPEMALQGLMPQRVVTSPELSQLRNGLSISAQGATDAQYAALDELGKLVAIIERRPDGSYGPAKYFPDAVT